MRRPASAWTSVRGGPRRGISFDMRARTPPMGCQRGVRASWAARRPCGGAQRGWAPRLHLAARCSLCTCIYIRGCNGAGCRWRLSFYPALGCCTSRNGSVRSSWCFATQPRVLTHHVSCRFVRRSTHRCHRSAGRFALKLGKMVRAQLFTFASIIATSKVEPRFSRL